jgi:hypothetical protein
MSGNAWIRGYRVIDEPRVSMNQQLGNVSLE